ncbi:cyclic AMP-dependent transcription factor ATF-4-like [Saccostrea echinata]|uniref:cyclic AMP-dependent transcription factor ATF-4-like n=1 Tax=Saccostrea echinata TaxID=191078 RepID=UPI002A824C63|nr:cyclic AMP-dependent transcription factor ATF-4-like [Saccostrea echinata]
MGSMAEDILSTIKDDELRNASLEAKKSGCILPILKVELKSKIQMKRLLQGQDEIDLNVSSPQKKACVELTKEDLERKNKRQEQNRKAAKKFRLKEKEEKANLDQTLKELRKRNEELRSNVRQMEEDKAKIIQLIIDKSNST